MGCFACKIKEVPPKAIPSLLSQTYLTLNSGYKIPQFGLGLFQIKDESIVKNACRKAIKIGIRHIDTAHAYENETAVKEALQEFNIPRNEIFISSKLWPNEFGESITLKAIDQMLKRLGLEYLDLLLLHQQVGDYEAAYKEIEKAVEMGKVRSIGIANFNDNLDEFLNNCRIKPAVIHVECHPFWSQDELRKKIEKYGIIIGSWYPFGLKDESLINNEIFTKLRKKYNKKTNIQIILRWHIQKGNLVFPNNPDDIEENSEIFDFELTNEEMEEINKLGKTKKYMTLKKQDDFYRSWTPKN